LKDSTLQDAAFFHQLAHVSGNTRQIFMKVLPQMHLWIRIPIKFRIVSHTDPPWLQSMLSNAHVLLLIHKNLDLNIKTMG